jgi:hypothetical protein
MSGNIVSIKIQELQGRRQVCEGLQKLCAVVYEDNDTCFFYPLNGKLFELLAVLKSKKIEYELHLVKGSALNEIGK